MCTLAIAHNVHPEYPFVFIGNRDEFYKRPTENAAIRNGILSGLDLEKGGTWTGISLTGRMAFITNHRDFTLHVEAPQSRGLLTKNFLEGDMQPLEYLETLAKEKKLYDPYNIIIGDAKDLYFYSNIEDSIIKLDSGIHGLSNAFLNTPWMKVNRAKDDLFEALSKNHLNEDDLFAILENRREADVGDLPSTGIDLNLEKSLSSIFIEMEAYGTRHETVILIDRVGFVRFFEKFRKDDGNWELNQHEFQILNT